MTALKSLFAAAIASMLIAGPALAEKAKVAKAQSSISAQNEASKAAIVQNIRG